MPPKQTLTEAQVAEVRALKAEAEAKGERLTNAELARRYNVDPSTISRAVSGKSHVGAAGPVLAGNGESGTVPLREVAPSALNPRRHFDKEALAELVASICEKGILEPLLLRRGGPVAKGFKAATYTIIAGERRWRAARQCIDDGALPADYALPAVIREVSDDEHRLLALVENVQRRDLAPLEEAEGYKSLRDSDPAKWTVGAIAKAAGVVPRTVQLRLELVDKLSPKVQRALETGRINLAAARTLTPFPAAVQDSALGPIARGEWGWQGAGQIRRTLTRDLPFVSAAIFKRADYDGPIVELEGDKPRFGDVAQFQRLQLAAVSSKLDALKKEAAAGKIAFVEFRNDPKGTGPYPWDFDRSRAKKAGVLLELERDYSVKVHRGLARRAAEKGTARSAKKAKAAAPVEPWTQKHYTLAHQAKTRAMQDALAGAPAVALRLAVVAMIFPHPFNLAHNHDRGDNVECGPGYLEAANKLAAELGLRGEGQTVTVHGKRQTDKLHLASWVSRKEEMAAMLFDKLSAMTDAEVMAILALAVAGGFRTRDGYRPELGDSPLFAAVAAALGLDMTAEARALLGDDAALKTCRAAGLVEILRELPGALVMDGTGIDKVAGTRKAPGELTAKKLRQAIIDAADRNEAARAYVPRAFRPGTAAELAKAGPKAPAGKKP